MNTRKINPFNNNLETGLRVLSILNATFPKSYDLQSIVYLDYLTVHSGDVSEDSKSLHPPVPNRKGEMFVRREIIYSSLELFISKGLISRLYLENGIEYIASESSTTFLESLNEEYSVKLQTMSSWVNEFVNKHQDVKLKDYMSRYLTDSSSNLIKINSND
jgi:hypothetical protein